MHQDVINSVHAHLQSIFRLYCREKENSSESSAYKSNNIAMTTIFLPNQVAIQCTHVSLARIETGANTSLLTVLRATDRVAGAVVKADAVAARDRMARESFIVWFVRRRNDKNCEPTIEPFVRIFGGGLKGGNGTICSHIY